MFVRVEQRHKPHLPWATIAIIATCAVASLWLAGLPADDRLEWLRQWGTVPSKLFDSQAPMLQQLSELRILRLLTALFIHARPAPFAAPSIAGFAGSARRGAAMDRRDREAAQGLCCLSDPAKTRSAGQSDSHDANRTAASGA